MIPFINQLKTMILKIDNPVGHIRLETTDINPATYLGFGTWTLWGSGRVPIGVNTSDTDYATSEKTGGNKTIKLTVAQLPSHQHYTIINSKSLISRLTIRRCSNDMDVSLYDPEITDYGNTTHNIIKWTNKRATIAPDIALETPNVSEWTFDNTHDHTATSASVGSGNDINIVQPYITCYMWKRIA